MIRHVTILTLGLLLVLAGCTQEGEDVAEGQVEAMAEEHADDTVEPSPVVSEPKIPVYSLPVAYANVEGETITGFMTSPIRPDSVAEVMGLAPGDTSLPAVLLVHEWWGLNDNVRAMANRLAGEGFRVLAVDLYRDEVGNTPDEAQALMGQAMREQEWMMDNMQGAYQYLADRYNAPSVAVMGWCFGGTVALMTAAELPQELKAAVIYYGFPDQVSEDALADLNMPVLGIFGAEDTSIPVETVRSFESTLDDLGVTNEILIYENAGHAFANPTGQNYQAEAAAEAWDETVVFLRETLYGLDAPVEDLEPVDVAGDES
jgi:carboxymethylenebutenolidase